MAGDKECRKWRCRHDVSRPAVRWAGLEALESRLALAAVSWDGGGNGTSWEDPLNWSANTLPAAADDVTIDVAANPAITLSSGIRSVHSLVLAETLTITGGTLAVATSAAVSAVLTVNGGTISGGAWDLNGGLIRAGSSTASTLSGVGVSGEISLPGGANLRISGGIALSASSVIRLSGSASNSLGFVGSTTLAAGSISFENLAGLGFAGMVGTGVLTLGTGVTVSGGRGVIGQNVFSAGNAGLVNQGAISANIAGTTLTINTSGAGVFANPGSLSATGGGLLAVSPATWSSAGSISASTGSTVALTGGWSSTGSINVNGGTLTLGGSFSRSSLSGLVRTGGSLNLTGTLNNSGGTLTLSAATGPLALAGGTISGGSVVQSGGGVLIPGVSTLSTLNGVIVQGDLVLDSNTNLRLAGSSGMAPGSSLRMGGSGGNTLAFTPGATLVSGQIVCEAVGGLSTIGVTNGGGFTIASGASIRGGAATIGSLVFGGSGPVGFTNLGLIRADSPGAELKIAAAGGSFTNSGTVEAAAGATLNISGLVSNYSGQTLTGGTWRALNGSTVLFGPGAIRTSSASLYLEGNAAFAAVAALETTNGSLTLAEGYTFGFAPALGVFTIGVAGSLVKHGAAMATIPATVSLDNRGTLAVEGGTLQILGPVTQIVGLNLAGGSWRASDGAVLDIPWSTIRTCDAAVTLAGTGGFPAIASLGTVRGTLALADGAPFGFAPLGGVFSIEVGGSLVKAGNGTTTIPAGISLSNAGTVRVTGGTLSITGPIAQVVGATLAGGSWIVSGSGELDIPAAISASDALITLDGPGALFASITGLASNLGRLELLGGRQWSLPNLVNSGTVYLNGASSLTISGSLGNSGLVSIQDGALLALGGGQSSGEFTAASRGLVRFGGDHQFAPAAKLSGGGSFSFTSGTMTWSGTMTSIGKISFEGAMFTVSAPINVPARVRVASGFVRLYAAASFARAQLEGGSIEGPGDLSLTARLDWIGGEIVGTGRLLISPGASLVINAATPLVLERALENSGTVSWQSGSFKRLIGPVKNLSGATLSFSDAGKWSESGPAPQLINSGTVVKAGPAAITASAVLTNSGLVRVEGGTLSFDSGGAHSGDFVVTSGATLALSGGHTLAAGADISGAGGVSLGAGTFTSSGAFTASGPVSIAGAIASLQGTFSVGAVTLLSGSVSLAGGGSASSWWNGGRLELGNKTLSLTGGYTQTAAGVLAVRMDGKLPGQFGRVTSSGAISLSGGVEISWAPGYRPLDATPFDFVTGSSRTGMFGSVVIQTLGVYRTFVMAYLPTGVRLWVYAVGIEGP